MLALEFNPKQRDFIACGDSTGRVHVWQLGWALSNMAAGEHEKLDALFAEAPEPAENGLAERG